MFKVNDYVIYKRDVCIILEEKINIMINIKGGE